MRLKTPTFKTIGYTSVPVSVGEKQARHQDVSKAQQAAIQSRIIRFSSTEKIGTSVGCGEYKLKLFGDGGGEIRGNKKGKKRKR
jgi:3D (Asp-Asp-Asp) domain-containing protein